MHVPDLASRGEALDFLHYLENGQHLNLDSVHLDKAAALIIEPLSSGVALPPLQRQPNVLPDTCHHTVPGATAGLSADLRQNHRPYWKWLILCVWTH